MPHGGNRRPFGFENDRITHRSDEAEIVRALVARFLSGETVSALIAWLDAEGVPTVSGSSWRLGSIKRILTSARYAGLRVHLGEVVGPAVWEPIISMSGRQAVLDLFARRRPSGGPTPRRFLLSGLLRCGRCDSVLTTMFRGTTRRYVCASGVDHHGCGRLAVVAEPVERHVIEQVVAALSSGTATPEGRPVTPDGASVSVAFGIDVVRWAALDFDARVGIVKSVVDRVVVRPGVAGGPSVDVGRLRVVFRGGQLTPLSIVEG